MLKDPNKIMVAGDWHGDPSWAAKAIKHADANGANTILHVGDFGFWTPSERTYFYLLGINQMLTERGMVLFWVDGNHEDHSQLDECNVPGGIPTMFGDFDRIQHLPRGYRWDWWGLTFMALGGAHSVDRIVRREGVDWWPGEFLSPEQVEYASRPGNVDVIIAHDAPRGVDIPGIGTETKGQYFPEPDLILAGEHRAIVREIVDATDPALFIHGHYHVKYRADLLRPNATTTRVFGLDRDNSSLAENTMFLTPDNMGVET
ncbi:metallophosphoesterase family protein [Mycobacteroides abscessus]|uniref:metallophosphoesterase family protein n=1 Tax=Mycobacteroides abscessus TaxID=36809 RepID=UPI0009D0E957|nr:metallophosphoesterase [Mycobacteroides abscessus]SKT46662.1 Calcineurin-like phosphoesterase superfamily domain [Mycobacteroides abscessus subsp. bolletii]